MEVGLILRIAGIGIICAVLSQFLNKTGRDDHAGYLSLAGITIVIFMLISELGNLISLIEEVFGVG